MRTSRGSWGRASSRTSSPLRSSWRPRKRIVGTPSVGAGSAPAEKGGPVGLGARAGRGGAVDRAPGPGARAGRAGKGARGRAVGGRGLGLGEEGDLDGVVDPL